MIKSLASIKNIKEASLIANYDFDIIDIKNIDDGPLGYAGNKEVELISNKLNNRSLSVTAGNSDHPNKDIIYERLEFLNSLKIDYVKIGIFDLSLIHI